MKDVLPYGRQWIQEDDIDAVLRVLRGDWITQGPLVASFESKVSEFCGSPFAVAFSSGTAALHGAAAVAGLGPGDEWLTCPISFMATANAALYVGATPKFVDVEADGFLMDVVALDKAITSKTRAVVPVDYAGHPVELSEILAVARRHGLLVIEDACHSLGAEYRGQRIGCQSDMTVLSFHPVKHIATGEGGMVLTPHRDFYDKLQRFRSHGIVRPPESEEMPWFYDLVDLGYNYRLTDIQCALGISQMGKLESFLHRRQAISRRYDDAFTRLGNAVPLAEKPYVRSARHLYVLRIQFSRLGKSRAQVMNDLRERGVGSQVHYRPIHLLNLYQKRFGYKLGDFPWAESFYEEALSLPLYPKMSDDDVDRVIEAVTEVVG